jgi:acetyl-CoA C-acetyltransferase
LRRSDPGTGDRHRRATRQLHRHQCAVAERDRGPFDAEIAPFEGVKQDEGPRDDTSLEKMARPRTLTPGGRLTAGVSSQISDASAALLIASEQAGQANVTVIERLG